MGTELLLENTSEAIVTVLLALTVTLVLIVCVGSLFLFLYTHSETEYIKDSSEDRDPDILNEDLQAIRRLKKLAF